MSSSAAEVSDTLSVAKPRSIPSLGGLRALSIAIVMLAHSSWYFPEIIQKSLVFRSVIGNGRSGVAFFL
jgi:peptidoglycan/LPS O-acetylase OafA/YrhL